MYGNYNSDNRHEARRQPQLAQQLHTSRGRVLAHRCIPSASRYAKIPFTITPTMSPTVLPSRQLTATQPPTANRPNCLNRQPQAVVRYFTDYDLDRLNILDVAQVEMMHEAALYGRADTIRIGASRRRGSSMRRNGLNAKAADAAVAAAARPHALAAVPESRTATESRTAAAAAAPLGTAFALPAAQEEVILTPGALGIVPSAAALRHSADGSLLGGGGGGAKWKRAAEAVSLGQRQQQQQQSVDGALSSSSDLALVSQPTDSSACVSGETSAGGRRAGPGALPQQGPVPEDDDVVGADDLENAKAVYCMWRAQTSRPARLKINPLAGPLTIGPVQIYRHEPVPRLPPGPRWYDKLRLSALTRQRSGSGTSGGSSCCCCLCPAPLRADDGEVVPEPELRQLDAVALQFFVWASQQDLMWMLLEGPVAIARALKDEELRAWHRLQLYMWQTGPHGEAAAAAERAAREAAGGKAATFSFAAPDPYAEAAAAAAAAAPGVYPLQQVMVEGREEEEEEQQQEQQQQGPGAFAGPDEIQCAGSVPLPAGCQMACLGPRPPPPEEKQQLQSYTQQKSHERLDEKQQKLVQQLQQRVLRKSGGSLAAAQSGTGTTVTPAASVTPAAAAGGTAASPRAARRSFWSRVQRWATICTLWLQWAWLRFRWNPFMAFAHCVDEDDEDLKKVGCCLLWGLDGGGRMHAMCYNTCCRLTCVLTQMRPVAFVRTHRSVLKRVTNQSCCLRSPMCHIPCYSVQCTCPTLPSAPRSWSAPSASSTAAWRRPSRCSRWRSWRPCRRARRTCAASWASCAQEAPAAPPPAAA